MSSMEPGAGPQMIESHDIRWRTGPCLP
jgi:hypothetical protein